MTPFNLEAAKRGEPVVTRDGRPVRMLCWDVKHKAPMVGIVPDVSIEDGEEIPAAWRVDGSCINHGWSHYDLFMAPKKRTVWRVIYRDGDNAAQRDFASHKEAGYFFSKRPDIDRLPSFQVEIEE